MSPLDYKGLKLKANNRAVDWPSQTGLLVEHAIGASCGISAVTPNDLPTMLDWSLDGYRGNRQVVTYDNDRVLAVRCAKQIRRDEHAAGFGQIGAVIRERAGGVVSDHDQILEVVVGPPIGRVSVELRARVIHNERHRAFVRSKLQTEADGEWWRAIAANPGWGGRLVVLIELNANQDEAVRSPITTRADFLPHSIGAEWRALWGWPGSRSLYTILSWLTQVERGVAVVAEPAAPAQQPLRLREPARRKPTWDEVEQYLASHGHFVVLRGVEVAPLVVLLRFINRQSAARHVGRDVVSWRNTFGWSAGMIFQAQRGGNKRGGSPQWVGTRAVLKKLLDIY
jgi:hypothetical protein